MVSENARSTKNRTTAEMRERMVELREQNWTIQAIADHFAISYGTVQHWLLVLAGEASKPTPNPKRRHGPVLRNGKMVNPFTPEDDAYITALELQRFTVPQIARLITKRCPDRPRTPRTIRYRFMTLARQQERQAGRAEP